MLIAAAAATSATPPRRRELAVLELALLELDAAPALLPRRRQAVPGDGGCEVFGASLSDEELGRYNAGDKVVRLADGSSSDHRQAQVMQMGVVRASPDAVWETVRRYDDYPRMLSKTKAISVYDAPPSAPAATAGEEVMYVDMTIEEPVLGAGDQRMKMRNTQNRDAGTLYWTFDTEQTQETQVTSNDGCYSIHADPDDADVTILSFMALVEVDLGGLSWIPGAQDVALNQAASSDDVGVLWLKECAEDYDACIARRAHRGSSLLNTTTSVLRAMASTALRSRGNASSTSADGHAGILSTPLWRSR